MQFIEGWKKKVTKLWSIRLGLLAALLSGLEVIVPLFAESLPHGTFAILSFVATVAAMVARLVAQPELHK